MILPGLKVEADEELHAQRPQLPFKVRAMHFLTSLTVKRFLWSLIRFVLLTGLAFVILFPLMSKLANSLKPPSEMFDQTVNLIPKNPTFDNYLTVIREMNYFSVLLNTVVHCTYLAAIQAIVCTFVAYGFARFKFPGRTIVFGLVLMTVIVPPQTIIFPLIIRFQYFGLQSLLWISPETLNSPHINLLSENFPIPIPLLLMSITSVAFKNGVFIFLLRQYFKNIPKELEEAAFIDGAGYFRTFYKVMLPGAVPLMMTIFLFAFVWLYNDDFFWNALQASPNVMSIEIKTIADQIIRALSGQDSSTSQYAAIMKEVYKQSAVILHIIPLGILYVFTQRFFVQSIERSGLVG